VQRPIFIDVSDNIMENSLEAHGERLPYQPIAVRMPGYASVMFEDL
jgi:hypothetical protein